MDFSLSPEQQAMRDSLTRLINPAKPKKGQKTGNTMLRKIVARWVAEMDLGTRMNVVLNKAKSDDFDKLYDALIEAEGIGSAAVVSYVDDQILCVFIFHVFSSVSVRAHWWCHPVGVCYKNS